MAWRFGLASDIGGRKEQQDRVEVITSPTGDDYLVVADKQRRVDGLHGNVFGQFRCP